MTRPKKTDVNYSGLTREGAGSNDKRLGSEGRPSWRVCYHCKRSGHLENDHNAPPGEEVLYPVRDVVDDGKKMLEYDLCRRCLEDLWKSFREGWR